MDFQSWLLKRQSVLSPPDRLTALIQAAGRAGIPEGQLRSQIDLPMRLFDELMAALVSARLVGVTVKNGKRWYVGR